MNREDDGALRMSPGDVEAIKDVQSELGYILDRLDYEALREVYAQDVEFDNPSGFTLTGVSALIEQSKRIKNPAISHQITNLTVTRLSEQTARVVSRGITMRADRTLAFSEASDEMERLEAGWRITQRSVRLISGAGVNQYS